MHVSIFKHCPQVYPRSTKRSALHWCLWCDEGWGRGQHGPRKLAGLQVRSLRSWGQMEGVDLPAACGTRHLISGLAPKTLYRKRQKLDSVGSCSGRNNSFPV